ncbi:MAG: adenylosuccinate synthase [Patescibacteria group bacterium]
MSEIVMSIEQQLKLPRHGTVAVVDTQWGDTGKGKVVDLLAEWANIIARGTGGANAGHTIVLNGKTHTFHLIPSGILHDRDGKINVIGNGVAFDPRIVCEELALLRAEGYSYDQLKIAYNAKLVLPQHLVMDRVRESLAGTGKIGTTGRGIGPVYTDHVARLGLTVADMFNPDTFVKKLQRNLKEKVAMLQGVDPKVVKEIVRHEHLGKGIFYDPETVFDTDAIVNQYFRYADQLRELVCDTDELLRKAVGKQSVLLEGAQGVLLSVDCGIQPYVTSSDCSLAGLVKGVGLIERHVDRVFSIVKAPYMTRVGEGPFPTELGGVESAKWCGASGVTAKTEQEKYPNTSVNSEDGFEQGIGIRIAGCEYGATTGRPRRTGWLDLPLLRYAMQYAGRELILTKVDVLDHCKEINICVAYEYYGPSYHMGSETVTQGQVLETAIPVSEILANVRPIYKKFSGWMCSIGDIREWDDFPEELKNIVSFLEKETGANVAAVSVGPDREQIVAA